MRVIPRLAIGGTNEWTPSLFLGVMSWLPFRSSVRGEVQTQVREEPVMRRYAITCELDRPKRAAIVGESIRRCAVRWEHPLTSVWIIETAISAAEIQRALMPDLEFHDRLLVCEVGADAAEFNSLASTGGAVAQIDPVRAKNRMLTGIFSRNGQGSRHLKAATAGNLQSA